MRYATLALCAAAAILGAAATFPAEAQLNAEPVIVPARPVAFESVNLRLVVDDCIFNPESVQVATDQGVTTISMTTRACLIAGPTRVVDILVGAFAAGPHRVDLVVGPPRGLGPTLWSVTFTVEPLAESMIFPPPPRPLTNYSGLWWNSHERGWGLSIHQSATRVLVAEWNVYDAAGRPVWLTIQPGGWTDFRTWTGTVYRTQGPPFFGGVFDPALVTVTPVGSATLDFKQDPGTVGTATFTYTVDGVTATKTIRRIGF